MLNEPVHSQMFNNRGITKLHTLADDSIKGEVGLLDLLHTMHKIERKYGNYFPKEFEGMLLALFFLYLFLVEAKRRGYEVCTPPMRRFLLIVRRNLVEGLVVAELKFILFRLRLIGKSSWVSPALKKTAKTLVFARKNHASLIYGQKNPS